MTRREYFKNLKIPYNIKVNNITNIKQSDILLNRNIVNEIDVSDILNISDTVYKKKQKINETKKADEE